MEVEQMSRAEGFYNEIRGINQQVEESQKKAITLRLDISVVMKIDALCDLAKMSRNEVVSNLVEIGIEALHGVGDSDFAEDFQDKLISEHENMEEM
jgi:hypothetical protein